MDEFKIGDRVRLIELCTTREIPIGSIGVVHDFSGVALTVARVTFDEFKSLSDTGLTSVAVSRLELVSRPGQSEIVVSRPGQSEIVKVSKRLTADTIKSMIRYTLLEHIRTGSASTNEQVEIIFNKFIK